APLLGLPPGQLQGEPDVAALGIRALAGPLPAAGSEPPIEVTSTAEVGRGRAKHSRVFRRPLTTGEGRPAGYVAVIHDVTEEKEIEQIKNDFFSMVTHELKTPLTAVEGYSKLMLKGRPGPLTEDQRRFLQIITSQAEVLKQMIGDLLDVSRIAAGRLKLDPRPVQVASLLAGAQQRFAPQAAQQGIELCLQPPREQPDPTVRLDAPRIEQVLGNLLGNALKFTPEGGRICLSWGIDQGSFAFAVSDSGVGIPPGELPRIFDKFYQVDRVETRRAGGAGLGLYICREIVAAHGGTITAQGRVEGGTIFRVELPLDGLAPAGAGAEGEHR
ncbi:MAG: HAMP domain-containing histidine kinase, partial [Deltaproteobacteria bacterium]|nr:HAMP domain-containing histidine kinase [Deltaproteobacteria bacterium]